MTLTTHPIAATPEIVPYPVCGFSVDGDHPRVEAGVLTEEDRVELLEGWMIVKITRGSVHEAIVALGNAMLQPLLPPGWHLRIQSAITTQDSEPEPELTVTMGEYLSHHPRPEGIALVIEVADSSLARDREIKDANPCLGWHPPILDCELRGPLRRSLHATKLWWGSSLREPSCLS